MRKALAILLTICLLVTCVGCSAKTTHTTDTFTETMEAAGFDVQDVTNTTETNGIECTILIAVGEDYQVEFYQFADDATASAVFANNKHNAELVSSTSHTAVSSNNFEKYTQSSATVYWYIARVGNTMIYCQDDTADKDAIKDTMKMLGCS